MTKKKILIFTDSRGQHKHDPKMSLFWEDLQETYDVQRLIQPHKWTTILDFIALVRDGIIVPSDYGHIILWAGVVDFSPRPITSCIEALLGDSDNNMVSVHLNRTNYYNRRINSKMPIISRIANNRYLPKDNSDVQPETYACPKYQVAYGGEMTASLYSLDFVSEISTILNTIPNLIFIDTCQIHPEWDGNFVKSRPRNINEITKFNTEITSKLTCPIIRVSDWTLEELKANTVDSIHVTQQGSDFVKEQIQIHIENMSQEETYQAGNYVVTACDEAFFPSALVLLDTLFENSSGSVDGILVLDIGMTKSQRLVLENLSRVHVVDYQQGDKAALAKLPFNFFDKGTYGFKAYLLVKAQELLESKLGKRVQPNIMYIDSGILINKDLGPIFDEIEETGFFCVDHDDCHDLYGEQPFFLLNILSPKLFEEPGFDVLELDQLCRPYVKAGFLGYKAGGSKQHLIDEFWEMCQTTSVLNQPKAVTANTDRLWYRNNTKIGKYLQDKFAFKVNPDRMNYSNGRQDQTGLSYLIAKHNVKINNSRKFNFTVSTNLSRAQWDAIVARLLKKYPSIQIDPDTFWEKHNAGGSRDTTAGLVPFSPVAKNSLTILHRGALAPKDQIKTPGSLLNRARNINNDTFILLGNGPSLGDVDLFSLSKYKTFGLNAAYRAYEKMGFWPTYFGCFDALVCGNHSDKFKELIKDSPIEKFFFINYNERKYGIFPEPEIQNSPKFQSIKFTERTVAEKDRDDILSISFDPFYDMLTSGTNTIQAALLMGYRKIIMLGCDANYTEIVDGAKQSTSNKNHIQMEKTPDTNVNYWFDDYQQEGDKFNLPNLQGCQLPAWDRLATTIQTLGINAEIINCSPISQIDVFKKMGLKDALNYFDETNVGSLNPETIMRRAKLGRTIVSSAPKVSALPQAAATFNDTGTNSVQFYYPDATGVLAELQRDDVVDKLRPSQASSLMLYIDPRQLLARTLSSGGDPEERLASWVTEINLCMALYRKNRAKLAVAERSALTANFGAFEKPLSDQGISLNGFKLASLPETDPLLYMMAEAVLAKNSKAQRILSELRASSLTPSGVSQVASPQVSAALESYNSLMRNKQSQIKTAEDTSSELDRKTIELQKKTHEIDRKNAEIARKNSEIMENTERDNGARKETQRKQQEISNLHSQADRHLGTIETEKQTIRMLRAELEEMHHQLNALTKDRAHQMEELNQERDSLLRDLDRVYTSKSWRATAPLRVVRSALKTKRNNKYD